MVTFTPQEISWHLAKDAMVSSYARAVLTSPFRLQ
ncbi:hypothetical protein CDAR_201651, partial [Caerostris darwini]